LTQATATGVAGPIGSSAAAATAPRDQA
jgi:hypothetical protein